MSEPAWEKSRAGLLRGAKMGHTWQEVDHFIGYNNSVGKYIKKDEPERDYNNRRRRTVIVKWNLENARNNPDIVRFILDSEIGIITIEKMLQDYMDNKPTDEMTIKIKLSDDCKYVQKEWYKDAYINQLSSVKNEINRHSESHYQGACYGNLVSQIDETISCIKTTSNADRVRVRGHLNMILEYIPHLDMPNELEERLRRAIRNIENALVDRAGDYVAI